MGRRRVASTLGSLLAIRDPTRALANPGHAARAANLLRAQAPAHAFRHTRRAIQQAFGMPHGELFDWLEETPVASGSIGQVRSWLRAWRRGLAPE